jgi:hypothetical protein
MKFSGFAVATFCFFMLAGCASVPSLQRTALSADQAINSPPSDKAQIIFLQPFKPLGGMAETPLYDITGGDAKLLNVLSSEGKVVVLVDPGKHMFMAGGMGVQVMSADVEAGKRYYVLSRFIAYVGYQLRPIRNAGQSDYGVNNPKFKAWLGGTKVVRMTPAGESLYSNASAVNKLKAAGLDKWQRKSQDEREQLTLDTGDYIDQ